jgi:UDP-N-acetylglucosamine 2-epimerase (non-hydrolysing)
MPEEINRVLTDRLSSLLWTHSEEADTNLRAEGIPETSIERVGNAMIDSLCHLLPRIAERAMHERFGLTARNYMVATFHRPANVDRGPCLREIVAQLQQIARRLPVVWPAHPRTLKALMEAACLRPLENDPNVHLVEPMGYLDFASLVHGSRLVVTDSGGIQEETSYLGIPCLTVRPNTERPVTLRHGTNRLISPQQLVDSVDVVLAGPLRIETQIPYWDGCAAQRVTASLARNFL